MKISVRTSGSGSYAAIGDDSVGDFIIGFQPRMTGEAQVTPLFRAAHPFVAARGNRVWQLSGTIEQVHADRQTALSFLQSAAAAVPDFVDVKVEQDSNSFVLTPAVFAGFQPAINGCSTTITYTFIGADLTGGG